MTAKKGRKAPKSSKKAASAPEKTSAGASRTPARSPASPAGEIVDMKEAIRILRTTRPTFYRWLRSGKVKGMKVGRQWRFYRGDLERFLKGEPPRVDLPADMDPLIDTLRAKVEALGAEDLSDDDDTDVQRAASLMIVLGVAMRASDIHICPTLSREGATVATLSYRVDGVLHEAAAIDARLLPALVEQWKRLAACDVHEKQEPQDGRILIKPKAPIAGRTVETLDLRVCFLPAVLGEAVTVRILDRSSVTLSLDRIDYAPRDRERLLKAIHSPWGLVLLTGPTGSGKTTVLYAALNEVVDGKRKVMSVEDPVEFVLPGVVQMAVNDRRGVTFARALRAILRSDPDVVMVGEVRDYETMIVSMQCALTGHLVLTTLHADTSAGGLKRMLDMGVDPFIVADATKLVMSQRLVRCVCKHCGVAAEPDANQLELAAELARTGGVAWPPADARWMKAVGCDKCAHTGYRGRTVVAEMLEVTPEIGKALRAGASLDELRRIAVSQGMTTMGADGVRRAAAGVTTLEEVIRVTR